MLVAMLYGSALTLDPRESAAGLFARSLGCSAHARRGCGGWRRNAAVVWRESDGTVRIEGWWEGTPEVRIDALPDAVRATVCEAWYRGPLGPRDALWAPTSADESHAIYLLPRDASRPLTPADEVAFRGAFVDLLNEEYGARGSLPPALRTGDVASARVIWTGHLANAWALLLASGLVAWARPVARFRAARREWVAGERHARGECVRCGYSVAGLAGHICPECGHDHTRRAN